MRFGGFDHPPGQHNFDGAAPADQLGEPLGAAIAGDQAKVDLGLAEFGGRGRRDGNDRPSPVRTRRQAQNR